ncbi:hypothetical protein JOM56_007139 [Amanita muscaria]
MTLMISLNSYQWKISRTITSRSLARTQMVLTIISISEILKMQAIVTLQTASDLTGNGTRGSYNPYAKSADFFSTSLQSPDRQFRRAETHLIAWSPCLHQTPFSYRKGKSHSGIRMSNTSLVLSYALRFSWFRCHRDCHERC